MEKIIIKLFGLKEKIYIGNSILEKIKKVVSLYNYDKLLVVIDKQAYFYHQVYLDSLFSHLNLKSINMLFLDPVLKCKDIEHTQIIINKLIEIGASRKSCIISVGGGDISDLSGFAASIYMRGIDFIQIPTTLMSQCDAVIGKVAVNFGSIKNLVGSFYSPRSVFCEVNFLESTSRVEQIYGLVEIWKHAVLFNNKKIISEINLFLSDGKYIKYKEIIIFSLVVKRFFVRKDPKDTKGLHKALSLGHTLANFLEVYNFRHGTAVFYGIVFETLLSRNYRKISAKSYENIMKTSVLFEKNFLRLEEVKEIFKSKDFISNLKLDKINSYNLFSFVIPTNRGYSVCRDVSLEMVLKTIDDFLSLSLQNK